MDDLTDTQMLLPVHGLLAIGSLGEKRATKRNLVPQTPPIPFILKTGLSIRRRRIPMNPSPIARGTKKATGACKSRQTKGNGSIVCESSVALRTGLQSDFSQRKKDNSSTTANRGWRTADTRNREELRGGKNGDGEEKGRAKQKN